MVIGAIGHSFMNGYNADPDHIHRHPEISWPTGNDSWSFASRIGASSKQNVAQGGAPASTFSAQAGELHGVDLALVSYLDPAICPGAKILVDDAPGAESHFDDEIREGIRLLHAKGTQVLIITEPNVIAMGEAGSGRVPARGEEQFSAAVAVCAKTPGSLDRWRDMNERIQRIAVEEGAMSDGGAISRIEWTPDMITTVDGVHPSPKGLQAMADAVWGAYEAQGLKPIPPRAPRPTGIAPGPCEVREITSVADASIAAKFVPPQFRVDATPAGVPVAIGAMTCGGDGMRRAYVAIAATPTDPSWAKPGERSYFEPEHDVQGGDAFAALVAGMIPTDAAIRADDTAIAIATADHTHTIALRDAGGIPTSAPEQGRFREWFPALHGYGYLDGEYVGGSTGALAACMKLAPTSAAADLFARAPAAPGLVLPACSDAIAASGVLLRDATLQAPEVGWESVGS